jgi:hypothetical protein
MLYKIVTIEGQVKTVFYFTTHQSYLEALTSPTKIDRVNLATVVLEKWQSNQI